MTHTVELKVLIDFDHVTVTKKVREKVAHAVYRAIEHATEADIEGAEVLDYDVGQITVEAVS